MVEQVNTGSGSSSTTKMDIVLEFLEKRVLLIGQCNNTITYERRKIVLLSVTGTSTLQVASTLKEKAAFSRSSTLWERFERPSNRKSENKKAIYRSNGRS